MPVLNPPHTNSAFLRGAGVGVEVWEMMCDEIQSAGYHVVKDRTLAWHLSRGGVPMAFVDFTNPDQVQVALLKAKYQDMNGSKRMVLPAIAGGWFDADRERQPVIVVEALRQLFTALENRAVPKDQTTQIADEVVTGSRSNG